MMGDIKAIYLVGANCSFVCNLSVVLSKKKKEKGKKEKRKKRQK